MGLQKKKEEKKMHSEKGKMSTGISCCFETSVFLGTVCYSNCATRESYGLHAIGDVCGISDATMF
jgi:hypothetical protein